tara:strand:+ start:34228 stop:34467 length:240 start_codon:yes stop_codon:yes gene_type:complete
MSQLNSVLTYMKTSGGITSLDAFELFGATRLSAIIYNIKKNGYIIDSPLVPERNRYGKIVYVCRYALSNDLSNYASEKK